jgi:hypothetical protein
MIELIALDTIPIPIPSMMYAKVRIQNPALFVVIPSAVASAAIYAAPPFSAPSLDSLANCS